MMLDSSRSSGLAFKSLSESHPFVARDSFDSPAGPRRRPRRKDDKFFQNLKKAFRKTVAVRYRVERKFSKSEHSGRANSGLKSQGTQDVDSTSHASLQAEIRTGINCQSESSVISHCEPASPARDFSDSSQVCPGSLSPIQTESSPELVRDIKPICESIHVEPCSPQMLIKIEPFHVDFKVEDPEKVSELDFISSETPIKTERLEYAVSSEYNPYVLLERLPISILCQYQAKNVQNVNSLPTLSNPIVRLERTQGI